MKVIKAPEALPPQRKLNDGRFIIPKSVFLAGTIDMGDSIDWQAKATEELSERVDYIFNPRRDDWDSNWFQEKGNQEFNNQVSWEMTALDAAQVIFMNFLEDSKSPITLLELGLYAQTGKLVVCCPKKFWRRGNVEMVCDRYNIPLLCFDDAISKVKSILLWSPA
jgi:hypothetical protein